MLTLLIPASPLAPSRSPVRIGYRDSGDGAALAVLHGGWGVDIYPFDRQIAALPGAGHSPHSEHGSADTVAAMVRRFLEAH